eukprot:1161190-Pelagomonas_calceolata.AAC.10
MADHLQAADTAANGRSAVGKREEQQLCTSQVHMVNHLQAVDTAANGPSAMGKGEEQQLCTDLVRDGRPSASSGYSSKWAECHGKGRRTAAVHGPGA